MLHGGAVPGRPPRRRPLHGGAPGLFTISTAAAGPLHLFAFHGGAQVGGFPLHSGARSRRGFPFHGGARSRREFAFHGGAQVGAISRSTVSRSARRFTISTVEAQVGFHFPFHGGAQVGAVSRSTVERGVGAVARSTVERGVGAVSRSTVERGVGASSHSTVEPESAVRIPRWARSARFPVPRWVQSACSSHSTVERGVGASSHSTVERRSARFPAPRWSAGRREFPEACHRRLNPARGSRVRAVRGVACRVERGRQDGRTETAERHGAARPTCPGAAAGEPDRHRPASQRGAGSSWPSLSDRPRAGGLSSPGAAAAADRPGRRRGASIFLHLFLIRGVPGRKNIRCAIIALGRCAIIASGLCALDECN